MDNDGVYAIKSIYYIIPLNGLSFALKMSHTASRLSALAPKPYTVSIDERNSWSQTGRKGDQTSIVKDFCTELEILGSRL